MPTPSPAPSMPSPQKTSPNILEWILIVLVLVTITGLGYLFFSLTQLRNSVASVNAEIKEVRQELMTQEAAKLEKTDGEDAVNKYVLYEGYDLPVWYPSPFSVSDLQASDTAQEGIQILGEEGYQMHIYKISEQEYQLLDTGAEPRAIPTQNPFVKSVYAECVGQITQEGVEDCFFASFIVRFNEAYFRINVQTIDDIQSAETITDAIIDRIGSRSAPSGYRPDAPELSLPDFDSEVITIATGRIPFPFTNEELAERAKGCGKMRSAESFMSLTRLFSGQEAIRYEYHYQAWPTMNELPVIQDGGFILYTLPNIPGYNTLEAFQKDFQRCDADGQLHPSLVSQDYLVFMDACETGYTESAVDRGGDLSGLPFECVFIKERILPAVARELQR